MSDTMEFSYHTTTGDDSYLKWHLRYATSREWETLNSKERGRLVLFTEALWKALPWSSKEDSPFLTESTHMALMPIFAMCCGMFAVVWQVEGPQAMTIPEVIERALKRHLGAKIQPRATRVAGSSWR